MKIVQNKMTFKVNWTNKDNRWTTDRVEFYRTQQDPIYRMGCIFIDGKFVAKANEVILTRYYGFLDPETESWSMGRGKWYGKK